MQTNYGYGMEVLGRYTSFSHGNQCVPTYNRNRMGGLARQANPSNSNRASKQNKTHIELLELSINLSDRNLCM